MLIENRFKKLISCCGFLCVSLVMFIYPFDCMGGQDDVYPDTPDGVVKKFCQLDAEGMRLSGDTMDRILKYVTWLETGADEITVISGFKVGKTVINNSKAIVSVEHNVIGSLSIDFIPASNRKQTVSFKLSKINNMWKIEEPIILPHVHWKTAIAELRATQKSEPERKKELEAVINKISKTAGN